MRRVAYFALGLAVLAVLAVSLTKRGKLATAQAQDFDSQNQNLAENLVAQTPTDEVAIVQLTVPTNAVGVNVRSVSNDGKRIVFDSINDYDGSNVDSNREILLYDADLNKVIHLTTTVDYFAEAKDDNGDGTIDAPKLLRRITNNTPVISGDGTKIVFVSNAAFGGDVKTDDGNQEVYLINFPRTATKKEDVKITRVTDTSSNYADEFVNEIFSNYSPTINDDGSVIAFMSTRRVFKAISGGTQAFTVARESSNANDKPEDRNYTDDNGELFTYNVPAGRLTQVTLTRDAETIVNFAVRGFTNFPTLSGDGRRLAVLSSFNFPGATANKNTDFNGEIFLHNVGAAQNTFTQLTDTTGNAVLPINGPMNVLPMFSRPLNRDGSRLVFESAGNFSNENADRTREVFLATLSAATPTFKQLTNQATVDVAKNDYNFFPNINSAGTFITFGSTLNLTPASTSSVTADNADGSRDVFRYDVANNKIRQVTFTPISDLLFDQRFGVVPSFPDSTGRNVLFSAQSNLIATNLTLNPEAFRAEIFPVTGTNATAPTLSNAASFINTEHARGALVAAFGMQLAQTTASAQTATLPFELSGVRVTVGGMAAQVIFVSPGQVNFVMPTPIGTGDTVAYRINNNGLQASGTLKVVDVSPGVFSTTGDGKGKGAVQCGRLTDDGLNFVFSNPACEIGNDADTTYLIIYGTGWRNGTGLTVAFGDTVLTPVYAGPQGSFAGLDQINIPLASALLGKTDIEFTVNFGTLLSNKVTTSFTDKTFGTFTVANAASLEGAVVARGSLVVAQGTELAKDTADGVAAGYPTELRGVRVTIGGKAARLASISPTSITFIAPDDLAVADSALVTINNNGTVLRTRTATLDASAGLFTTTDNGDGTVRAKCGKVEANGTITLTDPPCSVGTEAAPDLLRVFGTGWRFAEKIGEVERVLLRIGDQVLTPTYAGGQPLASGGVMLGNDQIDVKLTQALAGKTDQDISVTTNSKKGDKTSKAGVKLSFK